MTAFVPSPSPDMGLVCPKCQQPRATVLSNVTSFVLAFRCQDEDCRFQWVSIHPSYVVNPAQKTENEPP